ncbi:MAG: SGNH/GDSL hydrolase family protein [Verrucomicrobiota bacterium]
MNHSRYIRPGDRILFQGDSITDAGRGGTPDGLGNGYVSVIAGFIQSWNSSSNLEIVNRGISGNRTFELRQRWKEDCLEIKPTVLSIKIGVNDVWRKFQDHATQKYISLPEYADHLEILCNEARQAGVREIILVSPTTITSQNKSPENDLLGEYVNHVESFSKKIGALYVDVRTPLMEAREKNPKIAWTPDGCHPGAAGHTLIAVRWYEAVFGVKMER